MGDLIELLADCIVGPRSLLLFLAVLLFIGVYILVESTEPIKETDNVRSSRNDQVQVNQ